MLRSSFRYPRLLRAFLLLLTGTIAAHGQSALTSLSIRTSAGGVGAGAVASTFTVEGTGPKIVLVRAAGPALQMFGVAGTLADPVLTVHDGTGAAIATNNGWGGTQALKAAFANAGAFTFSDNSKDAALLATLNPGTYTATAASASGASGTVLLEIYDTDTALRIPYIAARDHVGTGPNVMFTGFVVAGSSPTSYLVRALGPALTSAGVSGALVNPRLTIYQGSTPIATNDNWGGNTSLSDAAATAGLMPLATGSNDAAVLQTLSPGVYTVQVESVTGVTGIAMVEIAKIDATRPASSAPVLIVPPRNVTVGAGGSVTLSAPVIGRPTPGFQWRKNGTPISGATAATYTLSNIQLADAGNYTVAMTNSNGTTISAPFVVSIPTAAAIVTQPVTQTVNPGGTATFSVVATGSPAPTYQWFRDGVAVLGATSATLTLANAQAANAGGYTVRVSNSGATVTSEVAFLNVGVPKLAILAHPASRTVNSGDTVTLSVTANGQPPLRYQWLYNGATTSVAEATWTLNPVLSSLAGSYSVIVSDASGSVTSNTAVLTVLPRPMEGTYFGTFMSNTTVLGTFALLVRADGTGAFLGRVQASGQTLVAREVRVNADRTFRFPVSAASASSTVVYQIAGGISNDGRLTGNVTDINVAMDAAAPRVLAATPAVAGFYQGGAAGTTSSTYTIISAGGEAYTVTVNGLTAHVGQGTVTPDGNLSITTDSAARIVGTVQGAVANYSLSFVASQAPSITFGAANDTARTEIEKLANISTRSHAGAGENALIAGFVIAGEQPKPVLIRAIGPSLANFNVSGFLTAARLEVFRGQTPLAESGDWGAASNAAAVAAAAARLNAFSLAAGSRDAALLMTLDPGAYTAVVSGQGGASGASLVEVYDASEGPVPPAQRIVNIATRGVVSAANGPLIAGFVISGQVPKRVLVRGVGPTLGPLGVSGALARPQVAVYSGNTVLTQGTAWSRSPDAAAIAAAAQQVGAFALTPNSEDAALIVNLSPGAYSVHVSGAGTESGAALVEVYEVP